MSSKRSERTILHILYFSLYEIKVVELVEDPRALAQSSDGTRFDPGHGLSKSVVQVSVWNDVRSCRNQMAQVGKDVPSQVLEMMRTTSNQSLRGHNMRLRIEESEAKSDDEMVKVNNQDPWASEGETATAWRQAVS